MLEIQQLTYAQTQSPHGGATPSYVYDMNIAPGEIVVVRGMSGAGKSTLLDLIAGFLPPHAGCIILNGKPITGLAPERRPVSILFQEDNLFAHLSVGKNLGLALDRHMPKTTRTKKITTALDEVGLASFSPRRAESLSGGQKQRVALARTLLRNKPVLLLDEPFASLDDETADHMRDLVRRFTLQHHWHTLVVSHSRKDATELAARTYLLKDGRLTLKTP